MSRESETASLLYLKFFEAFNDIKQIADTVKENAQICLTLIA